MSERQFQAFEVLQKEHQGTLNKIDADAISKSIDQQKASYQNQLSDIRIQHHEELAQVKTLQQAKDILSNVMTEGELSQIKNLGQAKKLIQNQQQLEEEQIMKKHLESLLEILRVGQETGQFEGITLSDSILSDEERKAIEDRIRSLREELAKLKGTDLADGLRDTDPNAKMDVLGMTVEDWDKIFQNLDDGKFKLEDLMAVMGGMIQLWGQYNKLVANKEDDQIAKDEAANNKKKESLKQRLDSGALSQESFNKQVEKMDKDLDRKKAKVARDQAKRDRNVSLMSAIVNTATGITKVLASPGGIPGMVLAAIIGAMGSLQIATIASTPLPIIPGAETGGQFLEVTRAQDGKRFNAKNDPGKRGYVSNPTVLVGENGTEWVANANAVSNPTVKPILDVLDTAQKNGTIDTLNLSNIIAGTIGSRVQGRAAGGSFSTSPTGSTYEPQMVLVLSKLSDKIEILDFRLANLTANVNLLGPEGFVARMDELNTIKNTANL